MLHILMTNELLNQVIFEPCACLVFLSTGLQLWDWAILSGAGTTI